MVGGSVVLGLVFLLVESRASEPIIPLRLFRNRTISLASLTSLFAATLGGPMVRVAAFSYGVRKTVADRRDADAVRSARRKHRADRK